MKTSGSVLVTPWAVRCHDSCCADGKLVCLTEAQYMAELARMGSKWRCPDCGGLAVWDDEHEEAFYAKADAQLDAEIEVDILQAADDPLHEM